VQLGAPDSRPRDVGNAIVGVEFNGEVGTAPSGADGAAAPR
jgi:hypothetical protein